MLEEELRTLLHKIRQHKCEGQTVEVKSARQGCPERLYDTFSAFSNQDDGGVIVFGLDEKSDFAQTGVYDAQDLQTKLMEVGEQMTPIVRSVSSICQEDGLTFVSAEIPPLDLAERPCFKTAKGRLKGSYIRVGDGDKPMTEYEVYSYEAYRKKYRKDIRTVENTSAEQLDQLGKAQSDTWNPMLVTAMEALGQTENRYSGIPRIRHAMAEAGLPDAFFTDSRGEFRVCLYNNVNQ